MTETQHTLGAEQAAADLEAARANLDAVEEEIGRGGATERDLEAAERRVRFCEARLEGPRRREAEEAEEERMHGLEELAGRTRGRVQAAGVEKVRKVAERALERYVAACMEHNAAVDEAAGELATMRALPPGYALDMGGDGHSVVFGSESIRRVRTMVAVRDMGLEVLGRHLRGGYISLGPDAY